MSSLDSFVACYPRSGSTWLRFLLFEALTGSPADFAAVNQAIPYIGRGALSQGVNINGGRLFQTHELLSAGDRRVVYLVRDPRDVALSYYRWQLRHGVFSGTFGEFLPNFLTGAANPFPSWQRHVKYWLTSLPFKRGNLHLVKYEDLGRNPAAAFESVLDFLGIAPPPEGINALVKSNDLVRMREKEERAKPQDFVEQPVDESIPFIGGGGAGGWRNGMSAHEANRIERTFKDAMRLTGYSAE